MSAGHDSAAIRRILIAFDAQLEGQRALETALALAHSLRTELSAVFLENTNLLRLAGLPMAHETGLATAALRRLDLPSLERMFKAEAARIERSLASAGARLQVPWSLRVARGEPLQELLACAQEADLLVFSRARAGIGVGASGRTRFERPTRRGAEPILVVFDSSAASYRALIAGAALAQPEDEITLLVLAENIPLYDARRNEALRWLEQRALAARTRQLHRLEEVLALGARPGAAAIVAPASLGIAAADEPRRTLARLCTTLVLAT